MASCFEQDVDRYGRTVARCSIGEKDIGDWLVNGGLAIRPARYAGGAYIAEEERARAERKRVWTGGFVSTEDWRRSRASGSGQTRRALNGRQGF